MLKYIKTILTLILLYITAIQALDSTDSVILNERDTKSSAKLKELTRKDFPLSTLGTQTPIEKEGHSISAFYLIVLNPSSKEIGNWKKTILSLNARFSFKNPYPFVVLSEKELTSDEKEEFEAITDDNVKFGVFDESYKLPRDIDIIKVGLNFNELKLNADKKEGDDIKVHQLNRYKAGFLFDHELTKDYDYYMRLEPNSKFLCNFREDPFLTLKLNGKDYGFLQTKVLEDKRMLSLWDTITTYTNQTNIKDKIPKKTSNYFITRDEDYKEFNYCSFRNQVELGKTSLFQSTEYKDYFKYLDAEAGFFNELWDDASIQSTYIALFLPQSKIHWFGRELGYEIKKRITCPNEKGIKEGCDCDPGTSNDRDSCFNWIEMKKMEEELNEEKDL